MSTTTLQSQIREQEKDDENSSNLNIIICFDELRPILAGHPRYEERATAALE
jgi:hypothetical protein